MAHYSSKPCDTEDCCCGGEFTTPVDCGHKFILRNAWAYRILNEDDEVAEQQRFPFANTAELIAGNFPSGEYRLQIRCRNDGVWVTVDTLNWEFDSDCFNCCVAAELRTATTPDVDILVDVFWPSDLPFGESGTYIFSTPSSGCSYSFSESLGFFGSSGSLPTSAIQISSDLWITLAQREYSITFSQTSGQFFYQAYLQQAYQVWKFFSPNWAPVTAQAWIQKRGHCLTQIPTSGYDILEPAYGFPGNPPLFNYFWIYFPQLVGWGWPSSIPLGYRPLSREIIDALY